jgi:signal peptidase I
LEKQKEAGTLKKKSTFREYAEAAAIAVLLALFIRTFVVQAFKIPSGSMEPTLLVGDHILVNKFIYGVKIPFVRTTLIPISEPAREDVVVFIYPEDESKDFIKRIIGLPSDNIRIEGTELFVNDELFEDRYGFFTARGRGNRVGNTSSFGPVTVPEDHYFVMGDNRDHSYDSRFWGFVPAQSIKGKAFIIYWSWPNWQRFFHLIK